MALKKVVFTAQYPHTKKAFKNIKNYTPTILTPTAFPEYTRVAFIFY